MMKSACTYLGVRGAGSDLGRGRRVEGSTPRCYTPIVILFRPEVSLDSETTTTHTYTTGRGDQGIDDIGLDLDPRAMDAELVWRVWSQKKKELQWIQLDVFQ